MKHELPTQVRGELTTAPTGKNTHLHQLPQRSSLAHLLDNEQLDHLTGLILDAPDPYQLHDVLVPHVLDRLELFQKQKHLRHVPQVLMTQHFHLKHDER